MKFPHTPLKLSKSSYTYTLSYIYTHVCIIFIYIYILNVLKEVKCWWSLGLSMNLDELFFFPIQLTLSLFNGHVIC